MASLRYAVWERIGSLRVQDRLPEGSQAHFRSIVTDQHCRVLGSDGTIYAIGDAATIQQVYLGSVH